jgi:hypothetical protein
MGDVKEWRGFYDFPAHRSSSLTPLSSQSSGFGESLETNDRKMAGK